MTFCSAVATFTACTAPKNSPIKPVTRPVALRLARRYISILLVAANDTAVTTTNGARETSAMRTSMSSMATTATMPKSTSPWMSFSHSANSEISNTSPRKRLIASPGESGSAAAPGLRSTCCSRFLRRSAMVCTKKGTFVFTRPQKPKVRARWLPTSTAITDVRVQPVEASLERRSKNPWSAKPGICQKIVSRSMAARLSSHSLRR